jgi:integrase
MDKEVTALTRSDGFRYRQFWLDRIANDGVSIHYANKTMGHLSKMLGAVNLVHQLDMKPLFGGLTIEGEVVKQRVAFTPAFVQAKILATGALDGLNTEARHLVYLVTATGLRPSEACNLLPETIHLDAPIPYVSILPIGRVLKTVQSAREIPLVGIALDVMRFHPHGFARYNDNAEALSALANKYLHTNSLLETPEHSLYCLRHTFEDCLTAVEAPDKVVAWLMGHKWHRPRYGEGPTLEQKARWLQKIEFTRPAHY